MATVDWRSLFNSIGVKWKDKGRNCSVGRVNINCPFCFDDPSFHLSISEETGNYKCWRDASHWGTPDFLLTRMGYTRVNALQLIFEYSTDTRPELERIKKLKRDDEEKAALEWLEFEPALGVELCLDYLYSRGFNDPETVCQQFDLRYASKSSKHNHRVLFPLSHRETVLGWTGRAIFKSMSPKYLSECKDTFACFAGRLTTSVDTCFVVEGSIDAIKVNFALQNRATAVALCGKGLSASRLLMLMEYNYKRIFVCLDNGVRLRTCMDYTKEIAVACNNSTVRRAPIPVGYNDTGAMPISMIQQWYADM